MTLTARQTAFISEVYSTVQGEGPWAGQKQIFVRLAGCPLRCRYCDTPDSLTTTGHASMNHEELISKVKYLSEKDNVQMISFTGGEPLMQADFLLKVMEDLKASGFKIYLETAGVHFLQLKKIVHLCDVISMDIKLPSATQKDFWADHKKFLDIGAEKIFAKVVIDNSSTQDEVVKVVELIKSSSVQPTLVIQPVTPMPPLVLAPSQIFIEELKAMAEKQLKNVLIKTQMHKEWGIR